MARKSKTDSQLDELRRLTSEGYLQDANVRRALAEQGITLEEASSEAPEGSTYPGPETLPSDSSADSNADSEDEVTQLLAEVETLDATHQDRLRADALRRNEHPDGDDQAMRQALADDAQRVRGETLRQSLEQQQAIRSRVTGLADRIGTAPTPGGIAMLLMIMALLLLILIDVNGQPRLLWVWNVLIGRARLMSEQKAAQQAARLAAGGVTSEAVTGISEAVSSAASSSPVSPVSNGNSGSSSAPSNILALPSLVAADFDRYLHS